MGLIFKGSWNPKKSDYDNWEAACAMPDVDGGKLPYKNPDGTVNKQGVISAMKMIGSVKGASDEQKKSAAKRLISAAKGVGVSPTPKVLELAGQTSNKYIGQVEGSFEWIREKLQTAVMDMVSASSLGDDYYYVWVKDVFSDTFIIEDEQAQTLYEASWSIDEAGSVTIGEPVEVRTAYVAKRRREGFGSAKLQGPIVSKNAWEQVAYSAVLIPGEPDYDGDIVTKDQTRKVAHGFMQYRYHDFMHEVGDPVAETVESWISDAPVLKSFPDGTQIEYPEGTWFIGMKIADDVWPMVMSGEITGVSIMAVLEKQLAGLKSASKSTIEAAVKRVTLKDLEEEGEWAVVAVSLVDDPAVGNAKFYSIKSRNPERERGILSRLFSSNKESKQQFDESDHPRWPAGSPNGLGGQFKDSGAPNPSSADEGNVDSQRRDPSTQSHDPTPEDPTDIDDVKDDAGGYLENQIAKNEDLRPYEEALNKALYFLKNEDDDFYNDYMAEIPNNLEWEARMALAKALEARDYVIEYETDQGDGRKNPIGIRKRPKGRELASGKSIGDARASLPLLFSGQTNQEEVMTKEEIQALADALGSSVKSANHDLLKAAGVIKEEPSEEEKLASAFSAAIQPLVEKVDALAEAQATVTPPVAEESTVEVDTEAVAETTDVAAAVKALEEKFENELKALKRSSAKSLALDSEDEEDEEDDDYEDDGRDIYGRRIAPLKEDD